jgi:hypothetical protein
MYSFLHSNPLRTTLMENLPTFVIAVVIAEVFYKFHSFTLECLSFLGTWYVLDGLLHLILNKVGKAKPPNIV